MSLVAAGQCGDGGLAARLLGQSGDRGPQDVRGAEGDQVELVGVDLQVRRLRLTIEVQREVVGRKKISQKTTGGCRLATLVTKRSSTPKPASARWTKVPKGRRRSG